MNFAVSPFLDEKEKKQAFELTSTFFDLQMCRCCHSPLSASQTLAIFAFLLLTYAKPILTRGQGHHSLCLQCSSPSCRHPSGFKSPFTYYFWEQLSPDAVFQVTLLLPPFSPLNSLSYVFILCVCFFFKAHTNFIENSHAIQFTY